MNTVKCRRCKNFFEINGKLGVLCPSCIAYEEQIYFKVRNYVKENPGITVYKVAEDLNISINKVISYVREERLEITVNSKNNLNCKNCGKVIFTGIFCTECKKLYGDSTFMENKNKIRSQMHTAKDRKKNK